MLKSYMTIIDKQMTTEKQKRKWQLKQNKLKTQWTTRNLRNYNNLDGTASHLLISLYLYIYIDSASLDLNTMGDISCI